MAKSKYQLLLSEKISGEEVERVGLIAKVVVEDKLMQECFAIAKNYRRALKPHYTGQNKV